jgi:hypothetical protein
MLLIEKDRYKKGNTREKKKKEKKRNLSVEEENKPSASLSFSKKLCHPPPAPPVPSLFCNNS